MKKAKWQKNLTAKEIRHINETTNGGTLKSFKQNVAIQEKWRKEGESEPCFECKHIAIKLGLI